jgi:hypothetical protein
MEREAWLESMELEDARLEGGGDGAAVAVVEKYRALEDLAIKTLKDGGILPENCWELAVREIISSLADIAQDSSAGMPSPDRIDGYIRSAEGLALVMLNLALLAAESLGEEDDYAASCRPPSVAEAAVVALMATSTIRLIMADEEKLDLPALLYHAGVAGAASETLRGEVMGFREQIESLLQASQLVKDRQREAGIARRDELRRRQMWAMKVTLSSANSYRTNPPPKGRARWTKFLLAEQISSQWGEKWGDSDWEPGAQSVATYLSALNLGPESKNWPTGVEFDAVELAELRNWLAQMKG